jgi:uncharacterized membrane protein
MKKMIETAILGPVPATEDKETSMLAGWISTAIWGAAALIACILLIDYFGHSSFNAGTFGDFFGGMLNPLLTFLTFIALCITMIMQRVQLHDAKKEARTNSVAARLQAFETTFFNLIQLHNQIVQELRFDIIEMSKAWDATAGAVQSNLHYQVKNDPDSVGAGRQAFARMFQFFSLATKGARMESRVVGYSWIQTRHNHLFGHYFRNLYQILKFIKSSAAQMGDSLDPFFYSSILRAQLSANELRALVYNCDGDLVDNGNFRKLIIEFRILEHLPLRFDPQNGRLVQANNSAWDSKLYDQYFAYRQVFGTGQWTSGAFGENPAVAKYLVSAAARSKIWPSIV